MPATALGPVASSTSDATGALAELSPAFHMELIPLTDTLMVGRPPMATRWMSYVFYRLPDGTAYLHDGARATPKMS